MLSIQRNASADLSSNKTLSGRLLRDIFSYGGVSLLRNGVAILTLPAYVHWLSQEEFAALDILNAVVAFFSLVIFQINVGYARYYYEVRSESEQHTYVSTLFWTYLVASGAMVMLMTPIAFHVSPDVFPSIKSIDMAASLAVASFLPLAIFEFFLINARLQRNTRRFASYALSETLLRAALSVTFVMSGMGIIGYFAGAFCSIGVAMTLALWTDRGSIGRFNASYLRRNIRFTTPTIPGVLIAYVNQYATRFILLAFVPLGQIALYAFAMKIAVVAKFMVQALRLGWLPTAMSQMQSIKKDSLFFVDIFTKYVVISLVFLALTGMASPILVSILAPDSYGNASALVPVLVAAFLISGATAILDVGNQAAEKTYWYSIATAIGAGVGLLFLLLFIETLGIRAVAYGFLLSASLTTFVLSLGSQRSHRIAYQARALWALLVGLPLMALAFASVL